MQASVVGAGVSGLTTAIALQRAGWDVQVVSDTPPLDTTSVIAAAVWTIADVEPLERTRPWALRSREVFAELSEDPATGVVALRQREIERADPGPSWWEGTPFVRRLAAGELPEGYEAGWDIEGFMVEPPLYLPWLEATFANSGGSIEYRRVDDLAELPGLVVNCTGLGAAELVGDDSVYPIRGQVVATSRRERIGAISDESDHARIAYVYPRSSEMILGGTRQVGRSDLEPDPIESDRIVGDCVRLEPRLAGAEVLAVRVGLRPGRPEVRLEQEETTGRSVIHNYGHGGCGYILSWGCAEEVVALAGG
jgi:D-amino-acid oxidase